MNFLKGLGLIFFVQFLTTCSSQFDPEQFMPRRENGLNSGEEKIIIVSHHTLNADYLEYTLQNHNAYAKKNGYDYWFRNGKIDDGKYHDPEGYNDVFRQGLYWQKIEAVKQALELKDARGNPLYDWVMWIDADAFFTNFSVRIEDAIQKADRDTNFIIAQDFPGGTCVNTGIWLVKNNQQGRGLIQTIEQLYPYYKAQTYPEQQAVQDALYGYVTKSDIERKSVPKYERRACLPESIIQGAKVFPQRELNSYYTTYAVSYASASWQAGDYIAHVAGREDKLTLIKRLMACMNDRSSNLAGCEVDGAWRP